MKTLGIKIILLLVVVVLLLAAVLLLSDEEYPADKSIRIRQIPGLL